MGKKVLMALNGFDIGGAETHVAELSLELQRRGYEIIIASNGGSYVSQLEAAGLRHVQMPLNKRSWDAMHTSQKLLKKLIQEEKPDIVHAHARIPGYLCGKLQKRLHFPFVTTAHWIFHTNFLLNHLTNWGQQTIAVSEDIKTYLMENYNVPEKQITITINGIDTDRFSPDTEGSSFRKEVGLDADRPVICSVSRLDQDRSLVAKLLLEKASRLIKAAPGLQILIVGGGDDYNELKAKADALNRMADTPYIVMTGPRTDINQAVAACDAFIGVSRAALEAMSSAKPVILAGNEGCQGLFQPESLELAKESNFCCRGSQQLTGDMLYAQIVALFQLGEEERKALGDFGRQVILEEYSVARMVDDYERVYNNI